MSFLDETEVGLVVHEYEYDGHALIEFYQRFPH